MGMVTKENPFLMVDHIQEFGKHSPKLLGLTRNYSLNLLVSTVGTGKVGERTQCSRVVKSSRITANATMSIWCIVVGASEPHSLHLWNAF